MNWTFFEEVLGVGGVAFLTFTSVLALFWKADDALSKQLKEDISLRLMCLAAPTKRTRIPLAMSRIFRRVFGKKRLSQRYFFTSMLCGASAFTVLTLVTFAQNLDKPMLVLRGYVGMYMLCGAIMNPIVDYVSFVETQYVLTKIIRKKLFVFWLLLDFIFTSFIVLISLLISLFFVFLILTLGQFDLVVIAAFVNAILDLLIFGLPSERDSLNYFGHQTTTANASFINLILTTYFTSAWIWFAFLGSATIKTLSRSGPVLRILQYALPLDTHPMRSIGLISAPVTAAVVALI